MALSKQEVDSLLEEQCELTQEEIERLSRDYWEVSDLGLEDLIAAKVMYEHEMLDAVEALRRDLAEVDGDVVKELMALPDADLYLQDLL